MRAIDVKAPHAARAASKRRRTACRHTRSVVESLFEEPLLITPPRFLLHRKRRSPPAKQARLVMTSPGLSTVGRPLRVQLKVRVNFPGYSEGNSPTQAPRGCFLRGQMLCNHINKYGSVHLSQGGDPCQNALRRSRVLPCAS